MESDLYHVIKKITRKAIRRLKFSTHQPSIRIQLQETSQKTNTGINLVNNFCAEKKAQSILERDES